MSQALAIRASIEMLAELYKHAAEQPEQPDFNANVIPSTIFQAFRFDGDFKTLVTIASVFDAYREALRMATVTLGSMRFEECDDVLRGAARSFREAAERCNVVHTGSVAIYPKWWSARLLRDVLTDYLKKTEGQGV